MNNHFESENKLLIISPTETDFKELKIKFEEKDVQVVYLAQIKELSDDNSYDTYIFYYNGDKSFIFHEYENPAHNSYFTDIKEGTIQKYWKTLADIDKIDKSSFFKYSELDFNYKELDSILLTENELSDKKVKM